MAKLIPLWQQQLLDKIQANEFELRVLIPQRELAAKVRAELDATARLRAAEQENLRLRKLHALLYSPKTLGPTVDVTPIEYDVETPMAASWRDVDDHAKAMEKAKKYADKLDSKYVEPSRPQPREYKLVTGTRRGHGAKWS